MVSNIDILKIPLFAEKTGIGSDLPNGIPREGYTFSLTKVPFFCFF